MLSSTISKLAAFFFIAREALALPSVREWKEFSNSLDGRLHSAVPVSAPCFPIVNNKTSTVDPEGCAVVRAGYTLADFRSSHYPAYMFPQWETCQRTEEKCLLDSSNTSNPLAWAAPCQQGYVSEHYLSVSGPEDVQKAFLFAKKTGIHLSIKASGHDYKGRSGSKGSLNIWTRNLDSLEYTPNFIPEGGNQSYKETITFGRGVPFEDLYKFADTNNLTIIGGYHQTIAASGGWVMGGGHSVLSPVYGLGVDRVLQFRIVTPDGQYRVANSFTNPDLFWALRGGGGSTFGIVLESTFLAEPRMKLQVASMSFNRTATNYQPFLRLLVDESYKWGTEGWGGHMGPTNIINVNPLLTTEQAIESLKNVTQYVEAQNGTVVIEELPSWEAFFTKYVTTAQASVGVENTLVSRLIPTELFTNEAAKATLTNTMVQMIREYNINPYIVVGTPFLFDGLENATSVTPAWRHALWQIGGHDGWQWNSSVPEIRNQFQIAHNVTQLLRDLAPDSGAYFNEGDLYETDHEESFWGPNYPALLSIKRKYDPHSLLDCWQCVGWKGTQDVRYDCYLSLESH
ncbi:FAD-binding domain-containing protein [Mycena albidolilacea]|uniref:FAD-binding domain-containing protein n=1 Tax=Mycena albidolilacea TaxID=1033008 RepID=A0AAD6ZLM6_9AGAR|nr:FAD-binding domain-containing protein [Mycena albidolilacea]